MPQKYRKRKGNAVIAIQLTLDLSPNGNLYYTKWGGEQVAKQDDWLVNNNGEVYTVNKETFARTYRAIDTGLYVKIAPVWATIVGVSGRVQTKEGYSAYKQGDYLVSNNEDGTDSYCMSAASFTAMYEGA